MSAEQMRKEFEAWYVADAARQGVELDAEHMVSIRKGNTYGKDRVLLNGKWEGWQAAHSILPKDRAIQDGRRNCSSFEVLALDKGLNEHALTIRSAQENLSDTTVIKAFMPALSTQPQAPQGAVTPGFRLLPIEPTMEMYEAAGEELYGYPREKAVEWAKEEKFESYAQTGMEAWRAMVKAAPETPEGKK